MPWWVNNVSGQSLLLFLDICRMSISFTYNHFNWIQLTYNTNNVADSTLLVVKACNNNPVD